MLIRTYKKGYEAILKISNTRKHSVGGERVNQVIFLAYAQSLLYICIHKYTYIYFAYKPPIIDFTGIIMAYANCLCISFYSKLLGNL